MLKNVRLRQNINPQISQNLTLQSFNLVHPDYNNFTSYWQLRNFNFPTFLKCLQQKMPIKCKCFTFHERKRREVWCQCLRCAPHLNMKESQRWRRRRRTKRVQRHCETSRDGNRTESGWPHQSLSFLRLTRSRFSSRALTSFLRRHRAIWRERREAPSPLTCRCMLKKKGHREGIFSALNRQLHKWDIGRLFS